MWKLKYKNMTEIALIGKKIGMTREFYKTGQSVPVTVIKMEKGRIIDLIQEDKRGYKAVQVGFGKIKNSKIIPFHNTGKTFSNSCRLDINKLHIFKNF